MKISTRIAVLPILLVWACGNQADTSYSDSNGTAPAVQDSVSRSALEKAVEDPAVRRFYDSVDWRPVWNDEATRELEAALAERNRHGLDRVEFLSSGSQAPADREVALTAAAMRYAGALARGLIDPSSLYEIYTLPRPEADLITGLRQALKRKNLRAWLNELAPQDAEYRAISDAYRQLGRARRGQARSISSGSLIRPGDRDPRVPQIVAYLRRNGYLDSSEGDVRYTSRISEAVRRLQQDRGIDDDGIVGPQTLQALNTGDDDRARAAAVALERRRWLRRDPAATRIDVNTAAAMLAYYRDGAIVDRRKVIVGKPNWKTPQLHSPIYRLVANPTWTVPKSIQRSELAGVSASYLRNRNMVRRDGWIVQQSGPENALGLVKFDMRNDYAIYLHDTPAKPLFGHSQRQLSHGCVRVEDALGFAALLAEQAGISERWDSARATGKETFVELPDNLTVRLLYHPTYQAPSGEVVFEQDVYDWNSPIASRLGFGAGSKGKPVPQVKDLGP